MYVLENSKSAENHYSFAETSQQNEGVVKDKKKNCRCNFHMANVRGQWRCRGRSPSLGCREVLREPWTCRRLWKRACRNTTRGFSAQSITGAAPLPTRPRQRRCPPSLTRAGLLGTGGSSCPPLCGASSRGGGGVCCSAPVL